jgi:hypothetical protein
VPSDGAFTAHDELIGGNSVPVKGVRWLERSIKLIDDLDRLPTAHTCMSEFVLLDYLLNQMLIVSTNV